METLNADITKLGAQISKITNQMKNPNTKEDVKQQMSEFLPVGYGLSTSVHTRIKSDIHDIGTSGFPDSNPPMSHLTEREQGKMENRFLGKVMILPSLIFHSDYNLALVLI